MSGGDSPGPYGYFFWLLLDVKVRRTGEGWLTLGQGWGRRLEGQAQEGHGDCQHRHPLWSQSSRKGKGERQGGRRGREGRPEGAPEAASTPIRGISSSLGSLTSQPVPPSQATACNTWKGFSSRSTTRCRETCQIQHSNAEQASCPLCASAHQSLLSAWHTDDTE